MRQNGRVIVAAADGSSLSNPGPAGWAWYIDDGRWAAGGWAHGTNNMGELMAVLDLLEATADTRDSLTVLCDSQYVINALTKWLPGWKRKGWRKADGKPVLNVELLQSLDRALHGRTVEFEWVKGHAGHALNEAADARARAAALAFQQGRPVDAGPGWPGAPREPSPGSASQTSSPAASARAALAPTHSPADDLFAAHPAEPDADEHPVVALQRSLLTDAVRSDRDAVDAVLHRKFLEHDATGRISGRGRWLASLAPLPEPTRLEVEGVDPVDKFVVLLRWRARSASATTLRASLWVRDGDDWRLRFEQQTSAAR